MKSRGILRRLLGGDATGQLYTDELFAIRPGASLAPRADTWSEPAYTDGKPYSMAADGIAEVRISGVLSKRPGLLRLFGWSNQATLPEIAAAIRSAAADTAVRGILLCIDSPGGTLFGTLETAQAVAAADAVKPVHAYAKDEFCSAAYWIGAQARRVTTNAVAFVGSIGVYSVLVDSSAAAGMMGLEFHVIATGAYKGAGEDGVPITKPQLAHFQELIESQGAQFEAAVAEGRAMKPAAVNKLADGRAWVGAQAQAVGLTDGVETYAQALTALIAATDTESEPRPEEPPAPVEPDDEDAPTDLPPDTPEEEAMADKGTPETLGAEELGLFRKFVGLFKGESAPEPEKAAAAPALTNEQIDERVAAGIASALAAKDVDADLAALAGKVPPAVLQNAENRALLLEAKAKSPERYKAALALIAGQDASALLGGPVADAARAGEALVPSAVQEMYERNGIDAKRADELKRRYSIQ